MSLSSDLTIDVVENRVTEILRDLGFGAHESAVIIALNQLASATVADLHSLTGIHHANLYAVLDGLVAKGIVIGNEGRPKEYQFAPLEHIEDLLSSKIRQLVDGLQRIQAERTTEGAVPALIYTIRGTQDVRSKLASMIRRADERILLVGPTIDLFGDDIIGLLNDASERGVKVRAILGVSSSKLDRRIQQRIKKDTLAVNLVRDGTEAVISMPDFSVCGWADNVLISQQFEGFLEQTWKSRGRLDDRL